eukprot:TRINITY_DN43124_c0_g1_i1.p1 TRINITY_DN43124_c0_g1~~TRINITY_DN43124_c0_g1_i1.p1  ORF type:complete len:230 (+),score=50.98 TRINITY_DN43124_c0_g1_i1:75-692(+)
MWCNATVKLLGALLLPAAAFICPPESLKSAPVGLKAGDKCGGTCNTHGTCAEGLQCQPPKSLLPMLMGVQSAGTCVAKPLARGFDLLGAWKQQAVREGLRLLNAQSNSIYMLVPVAVLGAEEGSLDDGKKTFDLSLEVATGSCLNDGKHEVDDPSCAPVFGMDRTETFDLVVEQGMDDASFTLLKSSRVHAKRSAFGEPEPFTAI